jgi:hypothetical protein
LLCDSCNWQFVGFAMPGFISTKQTKSSKQKREFGKNANQSKLQPRVPDETQNEDGTSPAEPPKIKKRVRTRM